MKMIWYVLRRLAGAVGLLMISSVLIFSLLQLSPGDPATVLAGPDATDAQIMAIRHQLGLDRSMVTQYFGWLADILHGNLGMSYTYQQPISALISERVPSTVQLTISAALLMIILGFGGGVLLSVGPRVLRRASGLLMTAFVALPPFASGIVLIFVFAVTWHALPSGGDAPLTVEPASSIRRLILPAIALALPVFPIIAQLVATEMARSNEQEFVLTAQAKGARPARITWRHVLPNSIRPAIIELGIRIGYLLGGAVVVESIFSRTGLGVLLVDSVQNRDYPLSQILLLMAVASALLCQLASELITAGVDPRVRMGITA